MKQKEKGEGAVKRLSLILLLFLMGPSSRSLAQRSRSDMVSKSDSGVIYRSLPVPPELVNPWPEELEAEFQRRAHAVVQAQTRDTKAGVNTYFENEKRSYGFLMAHVLGGNMKALDYLQAQDHQHEQWHRKTAGIDLYACFTLKHQMRKYFYFGKLLAPSYRKQMQVGARNWTSRDPLRRPHYSYEKGKSGWGPDAQNSWVDVRSTENLWLMRVTSVYLMAEETGNATTRDLYRQHILDYTRTLYRIGIGEWDSENYHGHSITPLLNLYDFAKDLEVKAAAKACLDFYTIAGAIKYWRGGFNGPTKRDYNHAQPFGGSAANSLWMWFGEHPVGKQDHWESDEVHQITSAYRPPMAAVNLARKQFAKPVEIFAAKPAYDATTQFRADSKPEYLETQYIAQTYQLGTLTGGTSVDGGDVNGFKLLAWDETDGAIAVHAIPGSNPAYPGSPMYKTGIVSAENRIAQQENVALWLVQDGKSPWTWVVPDHVEVIHKNEVTFLKCDRTWLAIRPLGASNLEFDEQRTNELRAARKNRFPNHKVLSAYGTSDAFCGLAIEVGERESHASFEQFVAETLVAEIDAKKLEQGIVTYKSGDRIHLGIHWNDDPLNLGVWRNGTRRDLRNAAMYESPIIKSSWQSGVLKVNTIGATFRHAVD